MRIYRLAALALLFSQAGCTALQMVRAPGSELASARDGQTIVTQSDGRRVVLSSAHVRSDTIFGTDNRGRRYRLPLHDAETIGVRKFSRGRTVLLGVAVVAGVSAVTMLARGGNGPVKFVFSNCAKFPDSTACNTP